MASRPETVEALWSAGVPPATAEAVTRHLMEAGVLRRSTRGRHGRSRISYTPTELANIVIGLAAEDPIDAPKVVDRFAEHVGEPGPVVDSKFALPEDEPTLHRWLADTLQRLAALTPDERKKHRQDRGFLEFRIDRNDPNPYAATARFEWGPGQRCIEFRSGIPSLSQVLLEREEPGCQFTCVFRLSLQSLLNLATLLPPQDENAAAPARATASPTQPPTERERPGRHTPRKITTRERVLNGRSAVAAGPFTPHRRETTHARRTSAADPAGE